MSESSVTIGIEIPRELLQQLVKTDERITVTIDGKALPYDEDRWSEDTAARKELDAR